MRALRIPALLALLVSLSVPALALSLDPKLGSAPPAKAPPAGTYQGGGRVGGDTIEDAAPIGALPFSDAGATCGFSNDYDAACPYDGSTAPDVVYSYFPAADQAVTINLCASSYDTKVYVWQDVEGNLIACNDDAGCGYSGWQSKISDLDLTGGHTYYFVVDGYGNACGSYEMSITAWVPCVVECPPGALQEEEPPCEDNQIDRYNSGYNGFCWTPVRAQGGNGCATMCGKSCTYLYQGLSYRDTDWFTLTAEGGPVTATCEAEFPLQFILIWDLHCNNLQYIITTADACEPATLTWDFAPQSVFGLWVGPSVFTGVPESDYRFDVCGISGDDPPGYGGCCNGQDCCLMTELQCMGTSSLWEGAGSDCDPNPCPQPPPILGACCLSDGSCVYTQPEICYGWGGIWTPGLLCEPNPCSPTPAERTSWGRIKSSYR